MSVLTPLSATWRERHYTVREIAELWNMSTDAVRRLFINEPGVIVIQHRRRGTRTYKSLRIPESVAERVYQRLMNGNGKDRYERSA